MRTSVTAIACGISLVAAAGSLQPPPARAGSLHIVDGRGDPVGTLAGLSEGLTHVVLETAGEPVSGPVGREGFQAFDFTAATALRDPLILLRAAPPDRGPGRWPVK